MIMKKVFSFIERGPLQIVASTVAAMIVTVGVVSAATTISTNISTGGTLSVTGLSTLVAGSINQASSTVVGAWTVTGATSLANASTTQITNSGISWLNGDIMVNGFATTTAATGAFAIQGALTTVGANTLGSGSTAINNVLYGFCTLPAVTIVATSTNGARCTGATGITTSYTRVFVQATSTLPAGVFVTMASSTATGMIDVMLFNAGGIGNATIATSTVSLSFWAVK